MDTPNKTTVTTISNGPLVIDGPYVLINIDGNEISQTGKVYLCRCAKSDNKPFCDGAHKK